VDGNIADVEMGEARQRSRPRIRHPQEFPKMSGEAQIRYGAKARNREENLRNAAVPPPPSPTMELAPQARTCHLASS